MAERKIDPKFNIHESYRKVNIVNPYRHDSGTTPQSYLLDDYTGAAFAYSFRKLSSTYSGACIKARRSSDNTEQDIGFANDYIDKVSLGNFIGASSGYISVFYDQSGNNDNWTKSIQSEQPYVALNGVINDYNGKVVMMSQNYTQKLSKSSFISEVTDVAVIQDSTTNSVSIGSSNSNSTYYGFIQSGSTSTVLNNSVGSVVNYYINSLGFTGSTRGDLSNAVRGANPVIFTTNVNIVSFPNFLSGYFNASSVHPIQRLFERIVFPTYRSDRTEIEAAINSYYNLY